MIPQKPLTPEEMKQRANAEAARVAEQAEQQNWPSQRPITKTDGKSAGG